MEAGYYIRLETAPKGANHARNVDGKAAARNWDKLTVAARLANVRPLQDFVSRGPDATTNKQAWFSAREGLLTISRLLSRISHDKKAFENPRMLIKDLQVYENILSAADARGSRFHFSPDVEKPPEA